MEGAAAFLFLCNIFSCLALFSLCADAETIGVCYGGYSSTVPSPKQVANLLRSKSIGKIRLYDSNHDLQNALSDTGIEVTVGVTNGEIPRLAADESAAIGWVRDNVQQFVTRNVKIKYVAVGNEVLRDGSSAESLLQAMKNIQSAIDAAGLHGTVRVSTPHSTNVLGVSYPPSAGRFRDDVRLPMAQILQFLQDNGAPFMAHIYTYFGYVGDKSHIPLDYALLGSRKTVLNDGGRMYSNLFDATFDALVAAMDDVGFGDIPIVVAETGWPAGGEDSATVANAQSYNNNLIKHVLSGEGTPARPGSVIETYLFELYNEDEKGGDEIERHFGVFNADLSSAYPVGF